jgi:hypothetical protein
VKFRFWKKDTPVSKPGSVSKPGASLAAQPGSGSGGATGKSLYVPPGAEGITSPLDVAVELGDRIHSLDMPSAAHIEASITTNSGPKKPSLEDGKVPEITEFLRKAFSDPSHNWRNRTRMDLSVAYQHAGKDDFPDSYFISVPKKDFRKSDLSKAGFTLFDIEEHLTYRAGAPKWHVPLKLLENSLKKEGFPIDASNPQSSLQEAIRKKLDLKNVLVNIVGDEAVLNKLGAPRGRNNPLPADLVGEQDASKVRVEERVVIVVPKHVMDETLDIQMAFKAYQSR